MVPLDEQVDELIELLKENDIPTSKMQMSFIVDGVHKYICLDEYIEAKQQDTEVPIHIGNPIEQRFNEG